LAYTSPQKRIYRRNLPGGVGQRISPPAVQEDPSGWRPMLPKGTRDLRGALSALRFIPLRHDDGRRGALYEDTPQSRALFGRLKASNPLTARHMALASRGTVQRLWAQTLAAPLTDFACFHLLKHQPQMSAQVILDQRQIRVFCALLIIAMIWATFTWSSLLVMLNIVFAFLYLTTGMARITAVMTPLPRSVYQRRKLPRVPNEDLPAYSVLVPLYDEAAMVPHLLHAMSSLDYPVDKLDVLFLAEADDAATLAAFRALRLPDHMAVIAVPPSKPRTKPKALNFALPLTRGKFVTIFDAEDRPEPDQLRKAVAAFENGPKRRTEKLGCVQAALNISNSSDSFFTRHFALEYMALFDAFLPALAQLNLPIPLGGTSNHFRRDALIKAGGWDPYNVTEDADLGIRLARMGYTTQMIASTTYEEAPASYQLWVRQRARWFKGWWQTWLVHMRHPLRLMHDLGVAGFVTIQVVLLGVLISVLIHPFFLLAAVIAASGVSGAAMGGSGPILLSVNVANFVLGYAAAVALAGVGAERRGVGGIVPVLATIPLYWVCLSAAGFLALWELIRRPHHWAKTPHGLGNLRPSRRRTFSWSLYPRRSRQHQRL
jgi:glycosyltransferase XagB